MKRSKTLRAVTLMASAAATFLIVNSLAGYGYPEPAAPTLAQAASPATAAKR